jgi:hypothetical protein
MTQPDQPQNDDVSNAPKGMGPGRRLRLAGSLLKAVVTRDGAKQQSIANKLSVEYAARGRNFRGAPSQSSAENAPHREAEESTNNDAGSIESIGALSNPFADSHRASEGPTYGDTSSIASWDAGSIEASDQPRDYDTGDYARAARNFGGGKFFGVSNKDFENVVESPGDNALEPLLPTPGTSSRDLVGRRGAVQESLNKGATASDIVGTRPSGPSRDPRVANKQAELTAARQSVDNSVDNSKARGR